MTFTYTDRNISLIAVTYLENNLQTEIHEDAAEEKHLRDEDGEDVDFGLEESAGKNVFHVSL